MEPEQYQPVPLRNWVAVGLITLLSFGGGGYALYYFSKNSPRPISNSALIEQQRGIQSLVCDPFNVQHYNPKECEASKDLERQLRP